jgi:2'-5' RNA ligase
MRTFIAFTLPDEAVAQIAEWQQANLPPNTFPEPATNLHMTLAFLGDTPEELVPRINEILSQLDPSSVMIEGPHTYTEQPKLAFLEYHESGGNAIWEQLNQELNALNGYEPQFKPWLPHTTVWRYAPEHKPNLNPPLPNISFTPTAVTLYQSVRNPEGGATYQKVTSQSKWSNILDPVVDHLDQKIFDGTDPKPAVVKFIAGIYDRAFKEKFPEFDSEECLDLYLTGSLTTYQYSEHSDCDISVIPNYELMESSIGIPADLIRKELIALSIDHLDGTTIPHTTHPIQFFVIASGIEPDTLYAPGIRSAWSFNDKKWVVPPERERSHDVQKEFPDIYQKALDTADKMTQMLDHDPDTAREMWHQLHKKRQLDERAGLGDYSESNVIYKMLLNMGLFDRIKNELHEFVAKIAMSEMQVWHLVYDWEVEQGADIDKAVRRADKELEDRELAKIYGGDLFYAPHPALEHVAKTADWWKSPDIADWQHGMCDTYAKALIDMYPHLRLGIADGGRHFFGHDDQYAYDSLGRHSLPYNGVNNDFTTVAYDQNPKDWFEYYPYGENGGEADYARAKELIQHQLGKYISKVADVSPSTVEAVEQTLFERIVARPDLSQQIYNNYWQLLSTSPHWTKEEFDKIWNRAYADAEDQVEVNRREFQRLKQQLENAPRRVAEIRWGIWYQPDGQVKFEAVNSEDMTRVHPDMMSDWFGPDYDLWDVPKGVYFGYADLFSNDELDIGDNSYDIPVYDIPDQVWNDVKSRILAEPFVQKMIGAKVSKWPWQKVKQWTDPSRGVPEQTHIPERLRNKKKYRMSPSYIQREQYVPGGEYRWSYHPDTGLWVWPAATGYHRDWQIDQKFQLDDMAGEGYAGGVIEPQKIPGDTGGVIAEYHAVDPELGDQGLRQVEQWLGPEEMKDMSLSRWAQPSWIQDFKQKALQVNQEPDSDARVEKIRQLMENPNTWKDSGVWKEAEYLNVRYFNKKELGWLADELKIDTDKWQPWDVPNVIKKNPELYEKADAIAKAMGYDGIRVAMAERSGDPELDALIEEFMRDYYKGDWPDSWEGLADEGDLPEWGSPMPIEKFRHPGIAQGMCYLLAEELAKFLSDHGFKAFTSDDVAIGSPDVGAERFPWKGDESSAEDFNLNHPAWAEEDEFVPHNWVIVDKDGQTYGIDFTASQFGHTEFPMVQKFDNNTWQRNWSHTSSKAVQVDSPTGGEDPARTPFIWDGGTLFVGRAGSNHMQLIHTIEDQHDVVIHENYDDNKTGVKYSDKIFIYGTPDQPLIDILKQEWPGLPINANGAGYGGPRRIASEVIQVIYDPEKDRIYLGTTSEDKDVDYPKPIIIGTYKDGNVNLVTGHAWLNPQYFRRLWHFSFPNRPLHNVYMQRDGEITHLPTQPVKTAMAERTGDPQLDRLIEKFKTDFALRPYVLESYGVKSIEDFRDPKIAQGYCGDMASDFAHYLYEQDIDAWVPQDDDLTSENEPKWVPLMDLDTLYPDWPEKNPDPEYLTHAVTVIQKDGNYYTVDWTISQYGFSEFPMVQKLDDEQKSWKREWTSANDPVNIDTEGLPTKWWGDRSPDEMKDYIFIFDGKTVNVGPENWFHWQLAEKLGEDDNVYGDGAGYILSNGVVFFYRGAREMDRIAEALIRDGYASTYTTDITSSTLSNEPVNIQWIDTEGERDHSGGYPYLTKGNDVYIGTTDTYHNDLQAKMEEQGIDNTWDYEMGRWNHKQNRPEYKWAFFDHADHVKDALINHFNSDFNWRYEQSRLNYQGRVRSHQKIAYSRSGEWTMPDADPSFMRPRVVLDRSTNHVYFSDPKNAHHRDILNREELDFDDDNWKYDSQNSNLAQGVITGPPGNEEVEPAYGTQFTDEEEQLILDEWNKHPKEGFRTLEKGEGQFG